MRKCVLRGVPVPKHLMVAALAILFWSDSVQAPEFQNIFGRPPTEERPPNPVVPADAVQQARNGSSATLLAISKLFHAISLREAGVNDETFWHAMEDALAALSKSAQFLDKLDFRESYNPEFANQVHGVDDTRQKLASLLEQLDISDTQLNKISDLARISVTATRRLQAQITEISRAGRAQPIFPNIEPNLSVYLELGALISRIGEATYYAN